MGQSPIKAKTPEVRDKATSPSSLIWYDFKTKTRQNKNSERKVMHRKWGHIYVSVPGIKVGIENGVVLMLRRPQHNGH